MSTEFNTEQKITELVWKEKYRYTKVDGTTDEFSREDSFRRVVKGIYKDDLVKGEASKALEYMCRLIWLPAGRIQAGAGTGNLVTLINCYVSPTIQDSMTTIGESPDKQGIMDSLKVAALTQQQGGGIGMGYSKLRPKGAKVFRANSVSSGPLVFMDMYNAMCTTITSAGHRRGAMMATLSIDHPDVIDFIEAKQTPGRLTNFNVSVLVTDKFMAALENDEDWDLSFECAPADGNFVEEINGRYVYKRLKAKDLWDKILRNTYEYAEPGVIFIDQVNNRNNLYYCEEIEATNPCGEQPLPPNGACNLGAVNLAVLVKDPFGISPNIDWDSLEEATRVGVRFLDNVLDQTYYPTEGQRIEAISKRRIGLGITGLANMLQQMKVHYGTAEARVVAADVMKVIAHTAYRASIELAEERGPFPAFDADKYLNADFISKLPLDIREGIKEVGIRNSVLLTIAPTGTTSLYADNVSSGCEPSFAWSYIRKVKNPDGSYEEVEVEDFAYRLLCRMRGINNKEPLPDYMVSALELTVEEHLEMQAVLQKFVDSSISKTINCPKDISFEIFQNVYTEAYRKGLKGCTTYRPSEVRGSILKLKTDDKQPDRVAPAGRPAALEGTTYKIKWGDSKPFYLTMNDVADEDGNRTPFEIFINSSSVVHSEWIAALTRTVSAIFRRGGDVSFLPGELEQIYASTGGQWVDGKYVPSLVAEIGRTMKRHFRKIGLIEEDQNIQEPQAKKASVEGSQCPKCGNPKSFLRAEGCGNCTSCGYSNCG